MKLITLNAWGGRVNNPLLKFIEALRGVDIFCLQEVNSKRPVSAEFSDIPFNPNLFKDVSDCLPDHTNLFFPVYEPTYGLADFYAKKFEIKERGEVILYENPDFKSWDTKVDDHTRKMSWTLLSIDNKHLLVMNVHGHWVHENKRDTKDRLIQSQRIIEFMKRHNFPKILCGDFNLRPDTESVRMIVQTGMRDLITEYGITSTRSSIYTRKEQFADFIFVSEGIRVNEFKVLSDTVSDHAPLFLDFEVV